MLVRSYLAATGGQMTFFAPMNTAFDRIPEQVERRLLRDKLWLEQVKCEAMNTSILKVMT